jgi:hypothetical protein
MESGKFEPNVWNSYLNVTIDANGVVRFQAGGLQLRNNGNIIPKQPSEFLRQLGEGLQQQFIKWMNE